jgi:hypothetical protein
MTLQAQRRWLWMLSGALALAAAAGGAALALWPLAPLGDDPGAAAPSAPAAPAAPAREHAPLAAYAVVYQADLQRPLFDPPPPQAAPPPRPNLALMGTVIERGFTCALLKTPAGQVQWLSVGQAIDGAEVTAIAADSVSVRFAGEVFTLKVQAEGGGS